MYPQVHSGGSSSRCLAENSIAVSIYSSHLNFRRCYRLTRHPHVPSNTLRWLVVAVLSRKSHGCEYTDMNLKLCQTPHFSGRIAYMEAVIKSIPHSVEVTQAIDLTPAARGHIRKMLAKQAGKMIFRLSVKKSGCSGLSYVVDYVENSHSNDFQFPVGDDLVVFVERSSFSCL